MQTYINHHFGENNDEVLKILEENPNFWGSIEKSDLLHTSLYDIYDENGKLLAFFGNSHWNNNGCLECVLSYVYVKEEYRQKGIFKKIVKWTIEHNSECKIISIGASDGNDLAYSIYIRLFKYGYHSEKDKGTWFLIKDRR